MLYCCGTIEHAAAVYRQSTPCPKLMSTGACTLRCYTAVHDERTPHKLTISIRHGESTAVLVGTEILVPYWCDDLFFTYRLSYHTVVPDTVKLVQSVLRNLCGLVVLSSRESACPSTNSRSGANKARARPPPTPISQPAIISQKQTQADRQTDRQTDRQKGRKTDTEKRSRA